MKLYYVPQTRCMRPRWLLEEMGVPYDLVRLDAAKGETKSPEYLAKNPLGHVPFLVDGDVAIAESGAICMYLADKFPEKKMAPAPKDRPEYLQWMFFALSTAETPVALTFRHTIRLPEAERLPKLVEQLRAAFLEIGGVMERRMAGREFVVGDSFTAADVVAGHVFMWARRQKMFGESDLPAVDAWVQKLRTRPAFVRSSAD